MFNILLFFITFALTSSSAFAYADMFRIHNESSCLVVKRSSNFSSSEILGPVRIQAHSVGTYTVNFEPAWSERQKRYIPKELFFEVFCPSKSWAEYFLPKPSMEILWRVKKMSNENYRRSFNGKIVGQDLGTDLVRDGILIYDKQHDNNADKDKPKN